ncbi:hypothetical protein CCACVL1_01950 [Corchorus capsularis]|uniref:Uncharacterized protein n=1 Tax=Corchorus capsularis TaxID=210143 RepID=A0A1R3KDZ8_COCAP|nr:hypothetical protein CCACVL1_01950 [Corchorus capsularis]
MNEIERLCNKDSYLPDDSYEADHKEINWRKGSKEAIGLPKSWDGKETPQSNKVRSIVGRLEVRAAER